MRPDTIGARKTLGTLVLIDHDFWACSGTVLNRGAIAKHAGNSKGLKLSRFRGEVFQIASTAVTS